MTSASEARIDMCDRRAPYDLGQMPHDWLVKTVDERYVKSRLATIFHLAVDVARWPEHLPHYRYVRFHESAVDDGGLVEMSANRPFGRLMWPTWWVSEMAVRREMRSQNDRPRIRFRHVRGITSGMEVEWSFHPVPGGTRVRIVHVWNGPAWPVVGSLVARAVIAPVFVHGIAMRTLEGLARVAEQEPL